MRPTQLKISFPALLLVFFSCLSLSCDSSKKEDPNKKDSEPTPPPIKEQETGPTPPPIEEKETEKKKPNIGAGSVLPKDEKRTRSDFVTLTAHLEMYRNLSRQGYPTEEQGLDALVRKPTTSPIPRDWVQSFAETPLDIWSTPFKYRFPGGIIPNKPEIICAGPDKKFGTKDDLSSQD